MADATNKTNQSTADDAMSAAAGALLREVLNRTGPGSLGLLRDVELPINVNLGRSRVSIRDILEFQRGSVVELEKLSGEAVDICIGDEPLAIGEVIVFQDKLRIRVLDIVYPPDQAPDEESDAPA